MKRIVSALLGVAVLAALMIVTTTSAHAQSCNNASLTGNYGFTFSGFNAPGHGLIPFAGEGLMTSDGAGNASATFNFSEDGHIVKNNPYTATYTVNSDCTGTMTSTDGNADMSFVIVSGGAEVLFMCIDNGNTWILDAKKL